MSEINAEIYGWIQRSVSSMEIRGNDLYVTMTDGTEKCLGAVRSPLPVNTGTFDATSDDAPSQKSAAAYIATAKQEAASAAASAATSAAASAIQSAASSIQSAAESAATTAAASAAQSAVAAARPLVGTLSVSGAWTDNSDGTYSKQVTISSATSSSKVDLEPSAALIQSLAADGVAALYAECDSGTVTLVSVGAAPGGSFSVQYTVTEVRT